MAAERQWVEGMGWDCRKLVGERDLPPLGWVEKSCFMMQRYMKGGNGTRV